MENFHPIGIFDSGFGGLSVFKEIKKILPQYDYIYLGDNARYPYGTRSFDIVYKYTMEAVKFLFNKGCWLIILACNTASAKALRTIQQNDLPKIHSGKRVLGVLRPTVEIIDKYTKSNHIGIFGTEGTIASNSYTIEINKFFPEIIITQEACPMWVPLVENNEHNSDGADYFVKQHVNNLIKKDNKIDSIILGCTHYPFLIPKLKKYIPKLISIISQDTIVAESLKEYLIRHPEIDEKCSKGKKRIYYTTGDPDSFSNKGSKYMNENIKTNRISY
ncbi:glutamate racemase [Bacteroidota bacterium]